MSKFWVQFWATAFVGMVAHDAGLPFWRDWNPGDVSDLMMVTFALTGNLLCLLSPGSKPDGRDRATGLDGEATRAGSAP